MDTESGDRSKDYFLIELDRILSEWESEHLTVTREDKRSIEEVRAWHQKLRTAAIRLRERSLPDPWYADRDRRHGAAFWLRCATSAPNFR